MEDGGLSSIILFISLILLHGALQTSASAFANFRRTPVRERADEGDRSAKRLLKLADDQPRLQLTLQLTLTFIRVALVAVAYAQIALWVASPENAGLIITAALIVVALILFIVGDVVASAVGQSYADQLAPVALSPVRVLALILTPLITVIVRFTDLLSQIAGSEPLSKAVVEEELMTLMDESHQSGAIEYDEKEMIYSVLQFGETLVREVMIPRPDVTAVSIGDSLTEAMKEFIDSGHSRIPVYQDEIDNIRGMLYAKDLLRLFTESGGVAGGKSITDLMRPAYFVPETKRADALFKEMQHRKTHIAVVVDEYGGTAGIVTIEDLVEEIVGDIKDEFDANEEDEYVKVEDNAYVVDGGMNLDDVNELLDIDLPDDENDSFGGYIYSRLGRVPEVGETLEEAGVFIRIDAVENRRIRKVFVRRVVEVEVDADESRDRSRDRADKPAPDDPIEPARSAT
ncbi:MAG: HlyC/CorC family transporter [Anaerolineae bacterium]|nr:HlyC/CorC family transporter [Anaerolineae bacterium]